MTHVLNTYGDYLIFADESGDHGLETIDPQFPLFALVFCMISKDEYVNQIVPSMQKLKFDFWGHDQIILHEHDIRKEKGPFGILRTNRELRESFYQRLNCIVEDAPFEIVTAIIDKERHRIRYVDPFNPYEISMLFCMERMLARLCNRGQTGKVTHILVESRGNKEDRELELEFRRICDNRARWGYKATDFSKIPFELVFVDKRSNSSGLQLADLVARPIALNVLKPDQPNRAFDIIRRKNLNIKTFP
jgi:hypothetical protein